MPKLNIISNALVFVCVAITATICTVLAITSGDDALNKTKTTQQKAVDNCFYVADKSIVNQTNDYLYSIEETAIGKINKHFETVRLLTESIIVALQMEPNQTKLEDWEHLKSQQNLLYSTYMRFNTIGVTGIGVLNRKYQTLMYVEDEETLYNAPGTWTHHWMAVNNGTQSDYLFPGWPAEKRSSWGTVEPNRGWFYPGWRRNDDLTCPNTYTATKGAEPSLRCYNEDPSTFEDIMPLGLYFVPPGADNVTWSPPVQSGAYTAVLAIGSYAAESHPGDVLGTVFAGIDLRSVSIFLRELPLPGRARVYTVMRSSWLDTPLHLTGVSKGKEVVEVDIGNNLTMSHTMPANNATDPIIRNTALYIESLNETYEGIVKESSSKQFHSYFIRPAMNESSPLEEFFLRCVVYNKRGVDWFVCLTIDREHVMGEVDKEVEVTKNEIENSNKLVDDDLRSSRELLIILLIVTVVFLIVLSLVVILKVTNPILRLREEMASVAVMRLDEINQNRPLSWVTEVCDMQQSFQQMLQNLREYRNYMPQSILFDDSDNSSEECVRIDSKKSATSTLSGFGSDSLRSSKRETTITNQTKTSNSNITPLICSMEVKGRRISVAALNIVGLLKDTDCLADHTAYMKCILSSSSTYKGVTDSFSGDRVTLLFNAVRVCPSHSLAMVKTCQNIISGLPQLRISCAGAGGHSKCGNMGCDGMKKYTVLGSILGLVHIMERLTKTLERNFLIDSVVNKDANVVFQTRLENQLYFPKFHPEKCVKLFSVDGVKEVAEEEWMYQLQSGEKQDPGKLHTTLMINYCDGNYDEALQSLEEYPGDTSTLRRLITLASETKINYISSIETSVL